MAYQFTSNIRMGWGLIVFDHGMVAARGPGLSFSIKVFRKRVYVDYTAVLQGRNTLLMRGQMAGLAQADRKFIVTHITTLYNHSELKSITQHSEHSQYLAVALSRLTFVSFIQLTSWGLKGSAHSSQSPLCCFCVRIACCVLNAFVCYSASPLCAFSPSQIPSLYKKALVNKNA